MDKNDLHNYLEHLEQALSKIGTLSYQESSASHQAASDDIALVDGTGSAGATVLSREPGVEHPVKEHPSTQAIAADDTSVPGSLQPHPHHDIRRSTINQSSQNPMDLAASNVEHLPLEAANPASFRYFIAQLHADPKLPMVHIKQVDHSTGKPVVRPRNVGTSTYIFVNPSSPAYRLAGQVHRITFHDHVTGESAKVDVMFCNPGACKACNNGEPPISQSILDQTEKRWQLVHSDDVGTMGVFPNVFQPKNEAQVTDATLSAPLKYSWNEKRYNYSMVEFTGRKILQVDVAYGHNPYMYQTFKTGLYEAW